MKKYLLFLLLFAGVQILYAQGVNDSTLVKIETKDGNEFIGNIVREDSTGVYFKTASMGEFFILRGFIQKQTLVEPQKMVDGSFWFDNPQSSRYFWSPNGYGLNKGEGYYQNIWVLYNQVSVGVTDYFSVGAGMVPLFLFGGGEISTPVWVIPKFSIPVVKDKINVGLGVIAGAMLGDGGGTFGIAYGVGTFGNRDHNLNIGLGYGFTGEGWAKKPIITVSGMTRVSSKTYIMSENYFINSVLILSVGGRSFVRKVGIDYALIMPLSNDMDGFFAFPVLGITLPFGNETQK